MFKVFKNKAFKSGGEMQVCVDATLSTAALKLVIEKYKSRNWTEISRAVSARGW